MNSLSLENIKKELYGLQIDWKTLTTFYQLLSYKSYREIPSKIKELAPPELAFEDLANGFEIIGSRSMNNSYLKKTFSPGGDSLHLIKPIGKDTHFYVSVGLSEPIYWYYLSDLSKIKNQLEELILVYNMEEGDDFMIKTYAFIGSDAIKSNNILRIEERFLKSDYAESLLWGSFHPEYPFNRDRMLELPGHIFLKNVQEAMKQYENYYTVSTRTMFSKSTVQIIKLNGIYSVMVKYHPLNFRHTSIPHINSTLGRFYTEDLPIDIVMILHEYTFVDYLNLVEHSKPSYETAFQILDQLVPAGEINHLNKLISNITLLCFSEKDSDQLTKLLKYKKHLLALKEQSKN